MKERRGIAIFVETAPGRKSWVEQGLAQQVRPLTNVIIVPAADYYQQEELHLEAAMMVDHREKNEGAIVSFYTAIRC